MHGNFLILQFAAWSIIFSSSFFFWYQTESFEIFFLSVVVVVFSWQHQQHLHKYLIKLMFIQIGSMSMHDHTDGKCMHIIIYIWCITTRMNIMDHMLVCVDTYYWYPVTGLSVRKFFIPISNDVSFIHLDALLSFFDLSHHNNIIIIGIVTSRNDRVCSEQLLSITL